MADDTTRRPDHRPRPKRQGQADGKPQIITYVKPEMELYIAKDTTKLPPVKRPRKRKRHREKKRVKCTCNMVCGCEHETACGCNLVQMRKPLDVTRICVCNTVPVCTCNTVRTCACNRVATRVCACDLVCTCDSQCRCVSACGCDRHSGGGGGRSVCCCVPVIH